MQSSQDPSKSASQSIKNSPNFRDGRFQNLNFTPQLAEGYTMAGVMFDFLFKRNKKRIPFETIPSIKTDLLNLPGNDNVLVWFGHSSYFMRIDGKTILVDPVFSGNASPIPGTNKSFKGSDIYKAGDLPVIDFLFITHDHYDHLDNQTLTLLKPKIKKIITGLGVSTHLRSLGFDSGIIIEKDWNENIDIENGFIAYSAPARHFSGRGLMRNKSLWSSYILKTPSMKIYIGGDSGYDTHFAEIGKKHGPVDLAILDNGQYDLKWKYIHMLPEEVLQAAKDLRAVRLFPVHSSKFAMANHNWDEPLKRITGLNNSENIPIITPLIGEMVYLKDYNQKFSQWWEDMK